MLSAAGRGRSCCRYLEDGSLLRVVHALETLSLLLQVGRLPLPAPPQTNTPLRLRNEAAAQVFPYA